MSVLSNKEKVHRTAYKSNINLRITYGCLCIHCALGRDGGVQVVHDGDWLFGDGKEDEEVQHRFQCFVQLLPTIPQEDLSDKK